MDSSLNKIQKIVLPVRKYFVELCDNSNIHGVRYLTEKCLHWTERLWWIIALSVSLWLCGSSAHSIWVEWRDNPVTLSFTKAFVSEIPFPMVTICPQNKIKIDRFDLASVLQKPPSSLTELERMNLNALAHICPRLTESLERKENFTDEIIFEIIQNVAFQYRDIILSWSDEFVLNSSGVYPMLTEEGLCFAYNSLNSHDIYTDEMAPGMMIVKNNLNVPGWSLEKDFQNKSTKLSRFPWHQFLSGKESGVLGAIIFNKKYVEYECGTDQGYKMILSVPGDALKFGTNSYQLPLEGEVMASIKPKLTITSEALRKYTPNQRKCFFDGERPLRFFRIYSQPNCEAECLANFTKAECECVKFSMPRDKQTKICGTTKINCYRSAEKRLWSDESEAELFRNGCNCLPACISIEYESDIERMNFDTKNFVKAMHSYKPGNRHTPSHYCLFSTFYDNKEIEATKRIESNTVSDFLAFFGGLLGLFLGISALSIVELIYYSTLRLYWLFPPLRSQTSVSPFQQTPSSFNRFQLVRGLRALIVEFCDNSNIHGVIYFTRRGLHWIERLWWIIAFGLSLWLCTSMTINVWNQWQENPVKMTFDQKRVSEIPFPTVIICPEIKTMKRKIDLNYLFFSAPNPVSKISEKTHNDSLNALLHICDEIFGVNDKKLDNYPPFAEESIHDMLRSMALQFDDVMNECIWRGKSVNCSMYAVPVLTKKGLCFAFNAINLYETYTNEMAPGMMIADNNPSTTKWGLENGYKNGTKARDYPLRVYDSGQGTALEISLDIFERDFELFCTSIDQGFIVSVTVPGDTLNNFENYFRLRLSEETVITLRPKLTTTSAGLRKYDPNHRKCFFDFERKLRFYKKYSQKNCFEECIANFTKMTCGCVKFSHPRDNETLICGVGKIRCYKRAAFMLKLNLLTKYSKLHEYVESCNCLPSCTSIDYNPTVDRVKFDRKAVVVNGRTANISGIHRSKLVVFFEDPEFESEQREELYTITDLLSICGGLLGLFMGISLLSLIEIVYYSSLRWYWILRRPTSRQN